MHNQVKPFWFRITWVGPRGSRTETRIYTGTSLASILDRIAINQRVSLQYSQQAPRITRISALAPPFMDKAFAAMLDSVLRLENTAITETF